MIQYSFCWMQYLSSNADWVYMGKAVVRRGAFCVNRENH